MPSHRPLFTGLAVVALLAAWPFLYLRVIGGGGPADLVFLALPYALFAVYGIVSGVRAGRPGNVAIGIMALLGLTAVGGVFLGLHSRMAMYQQCGGNIGALGRALISYAKEHSDTFPAVDQWTGAVGPSIGSDATLRCPVNPAPGKCTYAMNRHLSSARLDRIPDPAHTVLLYETARAGDSPSGTGDDMPSPFLHPYPRPGGSNICWAVTADGRLHESGEEGIHW
jgi:hypothetical protein